MSKRSCKAIGVSSTSSLYHPKSMPAFGMVVKAGTMCTRLSDEEVLCVRSSCSRKQTGMLSLSHHRSLVRTLVEFLLLLQIILLKVPAEKLEERKIEGTENSNPRKVSGRLVL